MLYFLYTDLVGILLDLRLVDSGSTLVYTTLKVLFQKRTNRKKLETNCNYSDLVNV